MDLYLMRHGIADDASPDSERQLTREGRHKAADVLKLAKNAGVMPALILSSPYARARQTAEVAAEQLGYKGEILLVESLVPHGTPENVWSDIRDHAGEASLLLTSHEPLMSGLTAWLLDAPALRVDMKKAALVALQADPFRASPRAFLRWMAIPKMAGQ